MGQFSMEIMRLTGALLGGNQHYSLQNEDHPLPFKAYVSTLIVSPVGPGQCRVDWFANFEPKGATAAEAIAFAQGIYSGMIKDAQTRLAAS